MLVLTRKIGEKIKIGEDIFVSILEVKKSGVRIGIEAPKNVSILRHEVYERIQEENKKAVEKALTGIDKAVSIWRTKEGSE